MNNDLFCPKQVGNKYFRNVPIGMKFLTLYATMPDTIKFVEDAGAEEVSGNGLAAPIAKDVMEAVLERR